MTKKQFPTHLNIYSIQLYISDLKIEEEWKGEDIGHSGKNEMEADLNLYHRYVYYHNHTTSDSDVMFLGSSSDVSLTCVILKMMTSNRTRFVERLFLMSPDVRPTFSA